MHDALFYTFSCPNKGHGVKAHVAIRRDTLVMYYQGELVARAQAEEREASYAEEQHCYQFYFKAPTRNGASQTLCWDATHTLHISRYLNHSRKRANLRPKLTGLRIAFYAKRDIAAGEELLFDYGERSPDVLKALPWLKE